MVDAAKAAGFSGNYPSQAGYHALQSMKLPLAQLLEAHGLGNSVLIEAHLKPLLEAKEIKFFQKDGIVVSTRRVKDNGTRTKALDMAFKLTGAYASAENAGNNISNNGTMVVNLVRVGVDE